MELLSEENTQLKGLAKSKAERLKRLVISENFLKLNASTYSLTSNLGDLIDDLMQIEGESIKQIVYDPVEGTRPFTIDDMKNIRELRRLGKKVLSCAHKDSPIGKLSEELDIAEHLQFALAQRIVNGLANAVDWVVRKKSIILIIWKCLTRQQGLVNVQEKLQGCQDYTETMFRRTHYKFTFGNIFVIQ